jgi:hypothetical protein
VRGVRVLYRHGDEWLWRLFARAATKRAIAPGGGRTCRWIIPIIVVASTIVSATMWYGK